MCQCVPCDAHHLRTKGAGGKDKDCIPLCRRHHIDFHNMGVVSFADRYDLPINTDGIYPTFEGELPEPLLQL